MSPALFVILTKRATRAAGRASGQLRASEAGTGSEIAKRSFADVLALEAKFWHCVLAPISATIFDVRRVLTVLLLALVVVQLGPACGFASVASAESMQCCQARCPSHSSRAPASCCQISATSDKAVPSASATAQAPVHLASTADLFQLHRVSDLSWLVYRSPAPPPQNSLALLCSRQI